MAEELTLPEGLILLALNDASGARGGNYVAYALAGAGLSELALRGILREAADPPNRFSLVHDTQTGDAFLDGCIGIVRQNGLKKPPKQLIAQIASTKGLVESLLDQLVSRGILTVRTRKILFVFDQKLYPEASPDPERTLKARLAQVMFENAPATSRDSVLIALAKQTGLLPLNFDRAMLSQHKSRIDEIANGKILATGATADAISAVQTAIMIAVMVPILIT